MDSNGKRAGAVTPVKDPQSVRPKFSEKSKNSENFNPNLTSPVSKISKSPAVKSGSKPQKPADLKNPNPLVSPSPRNKIRERKFVVAKKNLKREKAKALNVTCKCRAGANSDKCLCVAYETLRASQEDFFKNRGQAHDLAVEDFEGGEEQEKELNQNPKIAGEVDGFDVDRAADGTGDDPTKQASGNGGSTNSKRGRAKLMEAARRSAPDPGSGKVMHLVQAFEKLLTIPKSTDTEENESEKVEEENENEEEAKRGTEWELPGLRPKAPETQISSSSFCPSDFVLTSESLGLNSNVCSSLSSSQGSFSISNRASGGGRQSRRHSSESTGTYGGRQWKRRQRKITSQQPFKLRTEERGRSKEEEFVKKVQQMVMEEEKQRIPVAQGLPWTTDEPECLVKPTVKEPTRPIDLVLHSDVRAVERAEFDNQVQEKLSLFEQYKMERERQQKLAEEEELRRLRKELVPRAQPMPYFDRPFIPRRSERNPTIPKEPKFHAPQHKKIKSCLSWNNEMFAHQH